MAIRKQEFYEGAALHALARAGGIIGLRYEAPFFVINDEHLVYLKYSTKGRSPWGFTFTADERESLEKKANDAKITIGLVCGPDGVAAISYEAFRVVAGLERTAIHIACYRRHGEHYEVCGPEGGLKRKIAPSSWGRLVTR